MKKIFLLLLISAATSFSGCKKKLNCGDVALPSVISNSPAEESGDLKLFGTSTANDVTYYWTGPDNFSSTEQNPIVTNVSYQAVGTYKLIIFSGDCPSPEAKVDVSVVPATPPCTPANNSIDFAASFTDQYYTTCTGNTNTGSNQYKLSANNSFSNIYFYFNQYSEPPPGIYNILNYPVSTNNNNDAFMYLVGNGSLLYTTGGKLYIQKTGTKLSATFCGLTIYNSSYTTTANGKFIPN